MTLGAGALERRGGGRRLWKLSFEFDASMMGWNDAVDAEANASCTVD